MKSLVQRHFAHVHRMHLFHFDSVSIRGFITFHTAELNLVLISPGAKQLTLMFSAPSSTDSALVSPNKAVLLIP